MAAYRIHYLNDRTCHYARPDEKAGLHKHWIRDPRIPGNEVIHCMACAGAWHRPEPESPAELEATKRVCIEALRGLVE